MFFCSVLQVLHPIKKTNNEKDRGKLQSYKQLALIIYNIFTFHSNIDGLAICFTSGIHNFAYKLKAINVWLWVKAQNQLARVTLNVGECEWSCNQHPANGGHAVLTVEDACNVLLEPVDEGVLVAEDGKLCKRSDKQLTDNAPNYFLYHSRLLACCERNPPATNKAMVNPKHFMALHT